MNVTPSQGRVPEAGNARGRRLARAVTVLLFACQVASIALAGFDWAEGQAGDGFAGAPLSVLPYALVVFPALGIAGVGWAIVSTGKRWEPRAVALTFLAISVGMLAVLPPLTAAGWVASRRLPREEAKATQRAQRGRQNFETIRAAHYDALMQCFRTPQRVMEVRGSFLRLVNDQVIELIEIDGSADTVRAFESWAADNLVGRDVRVVIPDRVSFYPHYIPTMYTVFGSPGPQDPGTGVDYGSVPAVVLLGDEVVNARFCRNANAFGRFFREHVALNL